jgi:dihydropteroate synthase
MTKLVAIVNVTPDSFSDGGQNFSPDAAIAAAHRFIAEGADIIDIGAESTRPGATPLSPDEEWERLEPVLAGLRGVPFSVDTRHADTACKALEAGASWINDVSGFSDALMLAVAKSSDCKLVVMHSLTIPADKNIVMPDGDVVKTILAFGKARIKILKKAGIAQGHIIFDPGIGFGKTAAQSMDIIRGIKRFAALGVPILVGHSRKSFLSELGDRDEATLAVSQYLVSQGVEYLRVHEVVRHKQMLAVAKALYE